MVVKVIRLAIDTGRMDLAAHALVLAAIQLGAGRRERGGLPVAAAGSSAQTKTGESKNRIAYFEKPGQK